MLLCHLLITWIILPCIEILKSPHEKSKETQSDSVWRLISPHILVQAARSEVTLVLNYSLSVLRTFLLFRLQEKILITLQEICCQYNRVSFLALFLSCSTGAVISSTR